MRALTVVLLLTISLTVLHARHLQRSHNNLKRSHKPELPHQEKGDEPIKHKDQHKRSHKPGPRPSSDHKPEKRHYHASKTKDEIAKRSLDTSSFTKILRINEKAQQYASEHGGKAPLLFQGDIFVPKNEEVPFEEFIHGQTKRTVEGEVKDARTGSSRKWPNGVVPYVIDSSLTNLKRHRVAINEAIAELASKTCIRWVTRTNQADYVKIFLDDGCYSAVGRQGGQQPLSLGHGCETKGTAIHEMMHAIGFYHEQSRRDRDQYITIHFDRIQRGMEYNFRMYNLGEATTYNFPYDKRSIMHYGSDAFATGYQPSITSKTDANEKLGGEVMTPIDIAQIKKHYCGGSGGGGGGGGGGGEVTTTQSPRTQDPWGSSTQDPWGSSTQQPWDPWGDGGDDWDLEGWTWDEGWRKKK